MVGGKLSAFASMTPTHIPEMKIKGFVKDIDALSLQNDSFRTVLYTAQHCQLAVIALLPGEDIGIEKHKLDQFFRVVAGSGNAILEGVTTAIKDGFAVIGPAGTKHNIVNTGETYMKLYRLYNPPNHREGVVHQTRADAQIDSEHYDEKTTEAFPS